MKAPQERAVGFAEYLSYFAPALSHAHVLLRVPVGTWTWTLSAGQIVAVLSIVFLGGVNYLGVRSGSGTNAVLTTAKVAGLAMLPIFAIVVSTRVSPAWTPVVPPGVTSPFVAFGVAMISVLWANDGFYFLTYAAGEVKDPARNMPRALAFGLFGLLTLLASVAFPRTELTLLLLLFLALLLPYVAHYFRLENGVQRWYRLANEIERRAGTFPQVDRGPAGAGPERPAG
jgi:amino acid transporter